MGMTGASADPNRDAITDIVSLRLSVGLLGERDNAGWWASAFMSPTSAAFLTPIFGSHLLQARYQGVLESARRVHDERIGVGRVFHPFRLQEAIEQSIFDAVQSAGPELSDSVSSPDAARATLARLVGRTIGAKEGPALITHAGMAVGGDWVSEAASLYAAALGAGVQCFPYFMAAQ
jgi:hypothetical protein